jgi:hypothetical protein
MAFYELKSRTASSNQVEGVVSGRERDNANLARVGKKPVLKVCRQSTFEGHGEGILLLTRRLF